MPFTPKDWKSYPDTSTPINQAALEDLETRVTNYSDSLQPAKISNSLVDAKGDVLTATANDTPARLGVGTNNQVLTADSATATGLKWATPTDSSAVLAANGMGVAVHGSTAGFARPTGFAQITWIGTVEPTNMVNNDVWVDTS